MGFLWDSMGFVCFSEVFPRFSMAFYGVSHFFLLHKEVSEVVVGVSAYSRY